MPCHHKTLFVLLIIRPPMALYWCYDAPMYTVCALCEAFPRADQGPAMPQSVRTTLSVGTGCSGNQWDIVCQERRAAYSSLERWQRGQEH